MAQSSSTSIRSGGSGSWPALVPQGHLKGRPAIPLKRVLTVVGAIKTAHIHLLSKLVSQVHAVLVYSNGGLYVRDVASRTHTFVNDKPVREADLNDGDTLKVGEFTFRVRLTTALDENAEKAPEAMMQIDGEDLPLMLNGRTTVIGRRSTCDLPVANEALSTVHAIVFECNGMRMIRDFNSRAGTFVNGQKIHQTELNIGDEVTAGPVAMRYLAAAPVESEELPAEEDQPLERHPIVLDSEPAAAPVEEEAPPAMAAEAQAEEQVGSALPEPAMSDTTAGQEIPVEDTAVAQHIAPQAEDSVVAQELMPAPIEDVAPPPTTERVAEPIAISEPETQPEPEPAPLPVADEASPTPPSEEPVAPIDIEEEPAPSEEPQEQPAPELQEAPALSSTASSSSDNTAEPELAPISLADEEPVKDQSPLAVAPLAEAEESELAVPAAPPGEIDLAEISIKDDAAGFEPAEPVAGSVPTVADELPIEPAIDEASDPAALPIKGEVEAVEVPPLGPVADEGLPPVAIGTEPSLKDESQQEEREVEELKDEKEPVSLQSTSSSAPILSEPAPMPMPPTVQEQPEAELPPLPDLGEAAATALDFSVPEIEFPALDLETPAIAPDLTSTTTSASNRKAPPAPVPEASLPSFAAEPVDEKTLPRFDLGAIDEDAPSSLNLDFSSVEAELPPLELPKLDLGEELEAPPAPVTSPPVEEIDRIAPIVEEPAVEEEPPPIALAPAPAEIKSEPLAVVVEEPTPAPQVEPEREAERQAPVELAPADEQIPPSEHDLGPVPSIAAAQDQTTGQIPLAEEPPANIEQTAAPAIDEVEDDQLQPEPTLIEPEAASEPMLAEEPPPQSAAATAAEAIEPQAMPDEEAATADQEPPAQEMAAPPVEDRSSPEAISGDEALSEDQASEFLNDLAQSDSTGAVGVAEDAVEAAPEEVADVEPAPLAEEPALEEPIASAPEIEEAPPADEETAPPIAQAEAPHAKQPELEKPKRGWWPFGGKRKGKEPVAEETAPVAEEATSPVDQTEQLAEEESPSLTAEDVLPPEMTIEPPPLAEQLAQEASPPDEMPGDEPVAEETAVDIDALVEEELSSPPPAPAAHDLAAPSEPVARQSPKTPPPPPDDQPLAVPPDFGTDSMMYLGGMPLDLNKPLPPQAAPPAQAPPAQAPPPQAQPAPAPPPPQQQQERRTQEPAPAPPQPTQIPPSKPAAAPRPKAPMKVPPRPKLPSAQQASEDDTFLPGLDANFSAGPSVEAFQGLAMPPVRDVFSPLPSPAANDPFLGQSRPSTPGPDAKISPESDDDDGGATTESPPPPPGTSGPSARRRGETPHPGENGDGEFADDHHGLGANGDDFFSTGHHQADPHARRPISAIAPPSDVPGERKLPGVRVLLGFMLLLMFVSAGVIWFLIPPHYRIEGTLKYKDFANLSTRQKETLRAEQRQLLGDPDVRKNAAQFVESANGIAAGFLADPRTFVPVLSAAEYSLWPTDDTGTGADTLTFTVDSRSPQDDAFRVKALLTALWNTPTNQARMNQASKVSDIKKLEEQADRLNTRIKGLEARADEQKRTIDAAPNDGTFAAVQSIVAQRKQAWESAQAAVLELRAQLEQMKTAATQPVASTQPDDPKLSQLQKQLADARKKVMSIRSNSATGLAEARSSYDQAVSDFQKQTEEFQKKAKDIPELQAYASAASDLKDTARALADQLLRSQKDQREQLDRLIDLKNRMEEKLQARRLEMWNNDPAMRDLTQRLALATRKYNASSSAEPDRQQDLPALKKEMDDLKAKVADRQKALGDDTFYSETIAQLDKDIATGQRHLQENAASAEDARTRFEKNLQNLLPAGDKMTDEQKRLTAALRQSLLGMDAARKQYVQALAPANSAQDNLATVQNAIMELQAQIDSRRQELEAAKPKLSQDEQARLLVRNMDKKQAELTAAEKLADDAENALIKAQGQLTDMTNLRAAAKIASDTRDRYLSQIKDLDNERSTVTAKITTSTAEAHSIAYPEEPSMDNIHTIKGEDPRPKYILASSGGILLVFVLLMFISAQVDANEGPAALRPVSAMPQHQHDPHEPLQV